MRFDADQEKEWVELVRLYSNPKGGLERLPSLVARATLTPRPRKQHKVRQAQVRLDPLRANALATAYRDGKMTKELAALFGIHRATVTAVLQRLGVKPREKGLSDEQAAEACRLYTEGWSLARLAEKYNVTDMTVRRYLLLAGIVMRSPHERRKHRP
jgi:DNA-binding transcriptional regulator LsrR (DeoR family)